MSRQCEGEKNIGNKTTLFSHDNKKLKKIFHFRSNGKNNFLLVQGLSPNFASNIKEI